MSGSRFDAEKRVSSALGLRRFMDEYFQSAPQQRPFSSKVSVASGPTVEYSMQDDFTSLEEGGLAEEIRTMRKKQKLSETEMAELAGVSRSTIQKIESGSTDVTVKNLRNVMKAVGLELGWR